MNAKELRLAKKTIRNQHMPKSLEQRFIANGLSELLDGVYNRTAKLLAENRTANKALYTHLEQILPSIAFYEALLAHYGDKAVALERFDEWAYDSIKDVSQKFSRLMKTGLYRFVPSLCGVLLDKFFGEKAGFESRPVPDAPKFARDMTVCPYYETCKKYGCPEITQFFCKSDDITYGNMHPRLVWGRTQTLGTGGECCDFRLSLRK